MRDAAIAAASNALSSLNSVSGNPWRMSAATSWMWSFFSDFSTNSCAAATYCFNCEARSRASPNSSIRYTKTPDASFEVWAVTFAGPTGFVMRVTPRFKQGAAQMEMTPL